MARLVPELDQVTLVPGLTEILTGMSIAEPGDMAILISSSGNSPNMLNGAEKAKAMGLSLVTVSGFSEDNPLRKLGDLNLWVDSTAYNIVEMTHHVWLVAIIDYLIETNETSQ